MPATITILDSTGATQTVSTLDKITTQLPAALGSAAAAASSPVTIATDDGIQAKLGIVTETAPASDTASSGLNGRLQRIAQRLSSLIALLPTALGAGGGLKVDGSGTALPVSGSVSVSNLPATQPISAASLPLPAGAALETGGNLATVATAQGNGATGITIPTGGLGILGWLSGIFNKLNTSIAVTGTFWQATQPVSGTFWQATQPVSGTVAVSGTVPISAAALPLPTGAALDATLGTTNTEIGGLTETAPASDTASSGLNGRLQRVAQRLSSLIALLPTALGAGGGLKVDGSGTALPVSQGAASLVSATLQNAALATGNGTALNVSGMSAAVLTVNIVTTATVIFEGTQDGTNYSALNAVQLGTTTIASSTSAAGIALWELPTGGLTSIRARISAWVAGAVTVTGQAVPVTYAPKIIKTIIDQSVPGTTNGVQFSGALATGANVIGGVTIADGSNLAEGATTDAAATAGGTGSISAKLRRISSQLVAALGQGVSAASMSVVLASDQMSVTPWATASRLPTSELDALAVSGSVSSAAVLFTQDMAGYESISVQVTSAGTTCTITYETSDDNTNWLSTSGLQSTQAGNLTPITTTSAVGLNTFPKRGRYFRARVSTYTSGTVTVVGNLHKTPVSVTSSLVATVTPNYNQGTAVAAFGSGLPAMLSGYTSNPAAVSTAQYARQISTVLGAAIQKPYSIPEADWSYAAAASGIVNTTTAVTLVAAGAAGVKNYITALSLDWDTLGAATEVVIRNGASGTVIWRGKLQTASGFRSIPLPTPLQSSAATLLEFAAITAVTGGIYVNAQGYAAAD